MNAIKVKYNKLIEEQRWDIDYHLPPVEIKKYDEDMLKPLSECVDIITEKHNPTTEPEKPFLYVDISSVDVVTGMILTPQELIGEDAPSRARKVIKTGDIIISSCRPTRGAVAVVPEALDNQICSTGFCVIHTKEGVDTRYIHFILRSALVKEQFRKFSTGSSYPAILDSDVSKTIIPLRDYDEQVKIADKVAKSTTKRNKVIKAATEKWEKELTDCLNDIQHLSIKK